jgi:hypothetical protein
MTTDEPGYFTHITKVIKSMPQQDQEQARLWVDRILDQRSELIDTFLENDATKLQWDPASHKSLKELIVLIAHEPPGRGPVRPKGPKPPPPKG